MKLFADRDYDAARIRPDCPFLIQGVLFNSLLCRAEKVLAAIARELGEDPSPFEERARKTADVVNGKLWDEKRGTYLAFDLGSGRPIRVFVSPNFVPLFAASRTLGAPDASWST